VFVERAGVVLLVVVWPRLEWLGTFCVEESGADRRRGTENIRLGFMRFGGQRTDKSSCEERVADSGVCGVERHGDDDRRRGRR
jgi:hypothetical protein